MNLDLSTVRVALYAANVGKNIHLLRVPTMKHVFIGHGDSDKLASVNPFSKVYDEVWTAGRAGRDRYAIADVGVRDEDIVEVGRPQLAPIRTGRPAPPQDRDPHRAVRPHLGGLGRQPGQHLAPAGRREHREAAARGRARRSASSTSRTPSPAPAAPQAKAAAPADHRADREGRGRARRRPPLHRRPGGAGPGAKAELARIEARLADLRRLRRARATRPRRAATASSTWRKHEEAARLRAEWNDRVLALLPAAGSTGSITGAEPRLYDCFNASDAMVSDISSVVSDFIASGKPYAVTDSAELGAEEFKRQNTAVRAAVILSNSAAGAGPAARRGARPGGRSAGRGPRASSSEYLLGSGRADLHANSSTPRSRGLALKAEARNVGQESHGAVVGGPGVEPADARPTGGGADRRTEVPTDLTGP